MSAEPVPSGMLQAFRTLLTINNSLISRADLAAATGIDGPERNLDIECGYPSIPSMEDYTQQYDRNGCAARVIDVYPDETWSVAPEVYANENKSTTSFERMINDLIERLNLWHYMHRADRLSGVRRFGLLYLGFDDGNQPDKPVPGIDLKTEQRDPNSAKQNNLLFVRVIPEASVTVQKYESDITHPRFGKPLMYQIEFAQPDAQAASGVANYLTDVHWTRVVHFADNREESEIYGKPRLKSVYNYVFDVRKILGGSGEMFWKGGFPGLSIETQPGLEEIELDTTGTRKEVESYMNKLQRYIATSGLTVKSLSPQVADPTAHVTMNLQLITASIGCPMRVFLGSETGSLASEQDTLRWNTRLTKRMLYYANPMMIRPVVDRLIAAGVVPPTKKYSINWRDLNTMSEKDRADVTMKKTQALLQYVTSGAEVIMPTYEYFTKILGLDAAEAAAVIAASAASGAGGKTKQVWNKKTAQGGSGASKNPAKKTGQNRSPNPKKGR